MIEIIVNDRLGKKGKYISLFFYYYFLFYNYIM